MIEILQTIHSLWLWGFWSFVAWCGGPRHVSYDYARWEQYQARTKVQTWLGGSK
jgi:hypothetical protein